MPDPVLKVQAEAELEKYASLQMLSSCYNCPHKRAGLHASAKTYAFPFF